MLSIQYYTWISQIRNAVLSSSIVIVNAILVVQRRIDRISHRRFHIKKVLLVISQNSQENTCARNVFFKRLYYMFFSANFPKFVRALFLQYTFVQLPLYLEPCQISMIELFCGNTEAVAQRCSLKNVLRKRDSNPGTSVFL